MQFKNLKEATKYFSNEDTCREYLIQQRWNGSPICPYCSHTKVYNIEGGKRFKCASKECYKKFSVTVGTIYENSNLPLSTWFVAVWLITGHKKGISSCQLSRDLGITQKAAWFVLHRVREMLVDKAPDLLNNMVQVDETYVGGKMKNKHKSIRNKAHAENRSHTDNKTMVVGLLEEGNKVKTTIYKSEYATLKGMVRQHVDASALIVTDSLNAYTGLNKFFSGHEVVNHNADEYVNASGFHTNTVEGFFSQLKRSIYGCYHSVSPKHLHRYCTETAYRYNFRKITDKERFELTVKNCEGRLKYNELTGK